MPPSQLSRTAWTGWLAQLSRLLDLFQEPFEEREEVGRSARRNQSRQGRRCGRIHQRTSFLYDKIFGSERIFSHWLPFGNSIANLVSPHVACPRPGVGCGLKLAFMGGRVWGTLALALKFAS